MTAASLFFFIKQCGLKPTCFSGGIQTIATFSRSVSGRLSVNQPNVAPSVVVTSPHPSGVGN